MNWLKTYAKYTEDHEAPTSFHLWVGISVIAAVLERKVWTKLMFEAVYPNMYIVLVAPPGRCRKSSAMTIGTKLLSVLGDISISSDKITPEALLNDLENSENTFYMGTRVMTHCSLTMISKELGTLLSCRPEDMLKLLTDLYDSQVHDLWKYTTKGSGENIITGVWLNILGATIPAFFTSRQIQESIGLGFTSRVVFVYEEKRKKRSLSCDDSLKGKLEAGLLKIYKLQGEFKRTEEAEQFYYNWYMTLPDEYNTIEALAPFYERKHSHLLKLAMILSASEGGNNMMITKQNIIAALDILEETEKLMPRVFSGTGRNSMREDHERIFIQIMRNPHIDESTLIQRNYMHVDLNEIRLILQTLVSMRTVSLTVAASGRRTYTCIKQEKSYEKTKEL